jgi:hypothetical protein
MKKCRFCSSRGWDHDEIKTRLKSDLFFFTYVMVSDWVSPSLHKPIAEWYKQERDSGSDWFLVMLPRGHLKTTTFTISRPVWDLVNNPDTRILIIMSSGRLGKQKMNKIQSIIMSQKFKHFFPELVPNVRDVRWNKDEIEINRPTQHEEASITALGAESNLTSGHWNKIILDDLVDGQSENRQQQQQNAIDFMERIPGLWVRASDPQDLLVVGTFWPGEYYRGIVNNPQYKKIILGCFADDRYHRFMESMGYESPLKDDDPIFVGHCTKESIEKQRSMFKRKFAHQMLNIDSPEGDQRFRREDCQLFKWGDSYDNLAIVGKQGGEVWYPTNGMFKQLVIDPASGANKDTDDSAIVVTGWIRNLGYAFVLDVFHGCIRPNALIDKTIEMARRWDVQVVRPEWSGGFSMFTQFLMDKWIDAGVKIPIMKVKPGTRSKGERIVESIEGYIQNRQVFFRPDQQYIIDELVNLVVFDGQIKGASPNMVDALAYHTEFWRRTPNRLNTDGDIKLVESEEYEHSVRRPKLKPKYNLYCETRNL